MKGTLVLSYLHVHRCLIFNLKCWTIRRFYERVLSGGDRINEEGLCNAIVSIKEKAK